MPDSFDYIAGNGEHHDTMIVVCLHDEVCVEVDVQGQRRLELLITPTGQYCFWLQSWLSHQDVG